MAKHTIRLFVASPGDVSVERDIVAKLVAELNLTIAMVAPEKETTLETVRWETNTYPAAGRAQAVINEQIGAYDIFLGIMWTRFGTRTGAAESGTEEEFNLAYDAWQQTGRPEIMFYFCQDPAPLPTSAAAAEQLLSVIKFREKLLGKLLVWDYKNHADFADVLRPHLLQVLAKAMAANEPTRREVAPTHPQADLSLVQSQMEGLAAEYKRIRGSMPAGAERTRQMEVIVTKMRSAALAAIPLLPRLTASQEAGERLAAIAILQVVPQAEYIDWLGGRQSESQPFVAYHGAVALLTGVRALDISHRQELENAIQQGLAVLHKASESDRRHVLTDALNELSTRRPA